MELQCPSCSSKLQAAFYEGVGVHMCTGCRGVLLTKDELQQIARKRETLIPRNLPTPRSRASEVPLQCPRCRIPMQSGNYGKLRKTTFDMCGQCSSLWLDPGELESIQLDFEIVSENLAKSAQQRAAADGRPPDGGRVSPGAPPAPAGGRVSPRAAPDPVPDGGRVSPRASAMAGFVCPKCAHPQPRGDTCVRCGIVFAKYEAVQAERAARGSESAERTARVDGYFQQVAGFEVQQQYHLTEAIIGFERANRYTVQPVGGSNVGTWRVEESNRSGLSILGRNLFGSLYTFTMSVLDETRTRILQFERRARFYFYHLDIFDENGSHIGYAQRRFSFFNRSLTVHDEQGREVMNITGPYFQPWTFLLRRQAVEAGSIVKKWSGGLKELYTDADRFSLRFERNLDARMRRLALGAMMLIDSLYFEGRKPFLRHFFDAPGVQIIFVIALAAFLFGAADWKLPAAQMKTPAAAASRAGPAIQQREFLDLLERRQPLSRLAMPGQYTVVEVYLDTCPICRQLESGFKAFTARRPDVSIQRVHFPESGITLTVTGSTQEEMQAQASMLKSNMESICGTPHVEIYGPDERPLARDSCGDKSGTNYLRRWIAAETSMSLRELLTVSGANASTPIPVGN